MITIMGASGNIGSRLSGILLEAGQTIRVLARSAKRVETLAAKGAEVRTGDASDSAFLLEAFSGSKAVFAMIPPAYTAENYRAFANKLGASIGEAVRNAGVTNVVNLSSHGAHLPEGTGPVKALYDQEQRLNKISGVNVLHLRPTYFMENLLESIPMIKNMGLMGGAIKGNIPMPMIATRDIAQVAAEQLGTLDFQGISVRELYGQRDLTMEEATSVIGKRIGKPDLKYVSFPYLEAEKGLIAAGLSPDMSKNIVELGQALNDGLIKKNEERSSSNTTATSIEDFAEEFARAFHA
jgi:uncharacterized protein YbjT (DUF2867 family)